MKFHDTLSEKIFNGEELKPEVKEKLNEIADAFIEFLEVPTDAIKDVVLTGSMMSYNYTKYSDIDLHLLVDFEKVHEDCPLVGNYLISKKSEFNKNHDIFIYGIPVEVYAESIDNDNVHNGLYSLKQDKWIDFPKKIEPTDNDAAVEAKFNEFKDLAEICDDSEVAVELINKIKKMRKAGLAEGGEFSTENLTFKKLRDEGIIGKLMEIKKQGIDKQLSLESYNSVNETVSSRQKELKKVFDKLLKEIHDFGGGKILDIEYKDGGERPYYYVDIKNCGDWYKEDEDNECSWDLKWSSYDKFRDIVEKYDRKYRKDKIECNWGKSTWFYEDKKIHIVVRDDSKPHKPLFEGVEAEYSIKNESIKEPKLENIKEDEEVFVGNDKYIIIPVSYVYKDIRILDKRTGEFLKDKNGENLKFPTEKDCMDYIKSLDEDVDSFCDKLDSVTDDLEDIVNSLQETQDENIYKLSTIRDALNQEKAYYKSLDLDKNEQAPCIQVFVIDDNNIIDTKLIDRKKFKEYQPTFKEYCLDMVRDSGWWEQDYILIPVDKMVKRWNGLWENVADKLNSVIKEALGE